MSDQTSIVKIVTGRALPLRGNDIDTDRIIPARFLKCVVFDGLGEHAFEDDRKGLLQKGETHPFDNRAYAGASLLLVNQNFGCGSSREHAPQALLRSGIKALVGESFAEIFFGNCVSLGIPCFSAPAETLARLQQAAEKFPETRWTLDVEAGRIMGDTPSGRISEAAALPDGPRNQFLSGRWNALGELLADYGEVEAVAERLPYVTGWR